MLQRVPWIFGINTQPGDKLDRGYPGIGLGKRAPSHHQAQLSPDISSINSKIILSYFSTVETGKSIVYILIIKMN